MVVWSAVGLALALSACGGTSKKPKATLGEQPNCGEDECPSSVFKNTVHFS